ncbi:MAG: hypothetical protein H6558_10735 [Lewinellaceae bacterium]|nr:hypothetical protein [Lewinellaceae bacterium]MCB9289574.1 hypothetical protein [Lewinellaceae bacterium]
MEIVERRAFNRADNIFIPLAVLAAYLSLVLIDKDTHSISDTFSLRIVPGLLIYGIPGILVCCLLLRLFIKKYRIVVSVALAVGAGIPLAFTLVIAALVLAKNAGWF